EFRLCGRGNPAASRARHRYRTRPSRGQRFRRTSIGLLEGGLSPGDGNSAQLGVAGARDMKLLTNSSVVLIHGAWADASCWTNVIIPLQQCGLKVTCAQIPLTSLTADAAVVLQVLERTTGPVVLVGHAYGGAVMGAVASDRVKALVYIATVAPEAGETVAQVFAREPPHTKAARVAPDGHGYLWLPDEAFHEAVAHKASADQTRIMAAVQRPIAMRCLEEVAPAPAWKTKPSWFL